jgi:hypothetical protein
LAARCVRSASASSSPMDFGQTTDRAIVGTLQQFLDPSALGPDGA